MNFSTSLCLSITQSNKERKILRLSPNSGATKMPLTLHTIYVSMVVNVIRMCLRRLERLFPYGYRRRSPRIGTNPSRPQCVYLSFNFASTS